MAKYYLEFKTWFEGSAELPGQFRRIGEINDWRNKTNPIQPINQKYVQNVFSSFNESTVEKFLADHTPALIIGLLTDGENPVQITNYLESILGPIEVLGITEVTLKNQEIIDKIMGDAE